MIAQCDDIFTHMTNTDVRRVRKYTSEKGDRAASRGEFHPARMGHGFSRISTDLIRLHPVKNRGLE
jgi:hypothetical protein